MSNHQQPTDDRADVASVAADLQHVVRRLDEWEAQRRQRRRVARRGLVGAAMFALVVPTLLQANILLPHSFTDGEVADAAEVNANFQVLKDYVDAASGNGYPAAGTDVYTTRIANLGLFTAHTDDCLGTEAFVPLESGGTLGFCIEKSDRSAKEFPEARQDCLADGMRLPEVAEFQLACDDRVALEITDIIDGPEWSSNFALPQFNGTGEAGYSVMAMGSLSRCDWSSFYFVARHNSTANSIQYRCVR